MPANFTLTPELIGMVQAFKNEAMIADFVMPRRKLLSSALSFEYLERSSDNLLQVPDTQVGRKSRPNSVEMNGTMRSGTCLPYGLETTVPLQDVRQAGDNLSMLVGRELESLISIVTLGRELRVAKAVSSAANYDTANVQALSGSSVWTDSSSNPVKQIMDMLDKPLMRPNQLVMGQKAWTALRQHPKVVVATNRNSGDSGVAARMAVAELFEVDQILVGKNRVNTAKPGQTPSLAYCWGEFVAGHYNEPLATATEGIAWGLTIQSGDRISTTKNVDEIGLEGGILCKAGEYLTEIVTSKSCGFLISGVA